MRGEQDDRLADEGVQMFATLDANHGAHPRLRAVPEYGLLQRAAGQRAEVPARQLVPVLLRHLRKAELQIDLGDAAAAGEIKQVAQKFTDAGDGAGLQEMNQPEKEKTDAGHGGDWLAEAGGAPAGTL